MSELDMNFIVPGLSTFIRTAERIEREMEHEEEAWKLGDYIPDTWIENGVRHITIFGGDLLPERLTLQKSDNHWLVTERIPF